jgi:hypothetical protein
MGDRPQVKIPTGWEFKELLSGQWLLETPQGLWRGMATIDFDQRGFRGGLVQHGKFENEELTSKGQKRKEYKGLGWQQELVDDAVAYLMPLAKRYKGPN